MIATCPSDQRLRDYSIGKLDDEQSDLLFNHISGCDSCQKTLEQPNVDDTLIAELRKTKSLGENEVPDNFTRESDCKLAMMRAMATFADVDDVEDKTQLPETIGDYQIIKCIGRGGMGSVYLGRHNKLGRDVALKVISNHRIASPQMHDRFESEMKAVGKLNHPNIVNAYDAREVDGLAILVTEWVDGLNLTEIVQRTGPLSIADACNVIYQVAEALEAIDQKGLVHRDIKPSNIMINSEGQVKLLDLGLARFQGSEPHDFTSTGQTIGTADYVSPEQISDGRNVDSRTDIYSLGCTLFKLLTGQPPFCGDSYSTAFSKMNAHVSDTPPRLSEIDPQISTDISRLVDRMLAKDPANRPQHVAEVKKTLEKYVRASDLQTLIDNALIARPIDFASDNSSSQKSPKTESNSFFNRAVPFYIALAAGFAGLACGLLLGITITIRHPDGRISKVDVPTGSKVNISKDGDVDVTLPNAGNVGENVLLPPKYTESLPDPGNDTGSTTRPPTNTVPHRNRSNDPRMLPPPTSSEDSSHDPERALDVPPDPNDHPDIVQPPTGSEDSGFDPERAFETPADSESDPDNVRRHSDEIPRDPERVLDIPPVLDDKPDDIPPPTDSDDRLVALPDLGIDPEMFFGVWKIRFERMQSDTFGPNVMVFGKQKVAFFRNNYLMAEGNFRFTGSKDRGLIDLEVKPPQGSNLSENKDSIFWFSSELKGQFQRIDSAKARVVYTDSGQIMTMEKVALPYTITELPEAATKSKNWNYSESIFQLFEWESAGIRISSEVQEKLRQLKSASNLRKLVVAAHTFHHGQRRFPASQESNPKHPEIKHSWRVTLLPYLGYNELYEQYNFSEPWNSPDNLKVLTQMPDVFRHPNESKDSTYTNYIGFAGENTALGLNKGVSLEKIQDGTSQTLLFVESQGRIPWTKPEDPTPHSEDNPPFEPYESETINIAFADGNVRSYRVSDIDKETFTQWVIANDGLGDWNIDTKEEEPIELKQATDSIPDDKN